MMLDTSKKWNVIYLNFFLLQSCVGNLGKIRLLKLNLSASKMADTLKKCFLLRFYLGKNLSWTTFLKFVINFSQLLQLL